MKKVEFYQIEKEKFFFFVNNPVLWDHKLRLWRLKFVTSSL